MNNTAETGGDYRCQWADDEIERCIEPIVSDRIYCQTHADLADDLTDRARDSAGYDEADW